MLMIFLSWNMWNANTFQKPPMELRIALANKHICLKLDGEQKPWTKAEWRMDHSYVCFLRGGKAWVLNPRALNWHRKRTQSPSPLFQRTICIAEVGPACSTQATHPFPPAVNGAPPQGEPPQYSLILHHVHDHPVERVDILPNEVLKHDECLHQEILK